MCGRIWFRSNDYIQMWRVYIGMVWQFPVRYTWEYTLRTVLKWLDRWDNEFEMARKKLRPRQQNGRKSREWFLVTALWRTYFSRQYIFSYCLNHRIIPFCLPPHTTHKLQPLDVCIFSPYRNYYRRELCLRFANREYGVGKQFLPNSFNCSAGGVYTWKYP